MDNIPPPQDPQPQYFQPSPFEPPKKSNVGWIVGGILIGGFCLCIPIIGAILFPVFSQARVAAVKTQALADMKNNGIAVIIYQSDFDDKFPPNMGDSRELEIALNAYLGDYGNHWTILGTPTQGNPNLSGTKAYDLASPQSTVMLFCAPSKLNGKAVVAAADSSAKVVQNSALQLEITSNKYRMPSK